MRPVNLIPPEQRHGAEAPLRSGPVVYILVGALVAVLAAVTAMALMDSQISDRKGEAARLESEDAAVAARATRLASYTQFRALHEQRVATVASLADSRFDWERVMRELSLILPGDVWLTNLTAAAAGGAEGGGEGGGLGGSVGGPSLQLSGCAKGQEGVSGFVTALKEIDGVTRVGLQSSAVAGEGAGPEESAPSGGEGGSGGCSQGFLATFSITVAFDAAPVPSTEAEAAPVSATEKSESAAEEESGEGSEGG